MKNENIKELNKKNNSNNFELFSYMKQIKKNLAQKNIVDESEAEWLVAGVLEKNRAELKLVNTISFKQKRLIDKAVRKRLKGMPLTHIFKKAEFYGQKFYVNKHVLSPRFETEILVDSAINIARDEKAKTILDLCTGSGCIATVLKSNLVDLDVYASDISKKALKIAKRNSKVHNVNINFVKSNLFEKLKKGLVYDIIVSNPPYIAREEIKTLEKEVVKYDPKLALDGGEDGLDFYKKIALESPKFLSKKGKLILEVGYNQGDDVKELLKENFKDIKIINDYNNIPRIVIGTKKD